MENKEMFVDKTPFYMTYPMQNLYLAEMEYEKDMERMQELYPKELQELLGMVKSRCDELEQEGSRLYDENPDRFMMDKEACAIFEALLEKHPEYGQIPMPIPTPYPAGQMVMATVEETPSRFPLQPPAEFLSSTENVYAASVDKEEEAEAPETESPEFLSAQHKKNCEDSWLCHLVRVVWYDEVYRRRCRHRRCNRWQM